VAWLDDRDGNPRVYYSSISTLGDPLTDEVELSYSGEAAAPELMIDAGSRPVVFWPDSRDGGWELYRKVVTDQDLLTFRLTDFKLNDKAPFEGEPVGLNATVTSTAPSQINGLVVRFTAASSLVKQAVVSLSPGQTLVIPAQWQPEDTGPHHLEVVAGLEGRERALGDEALVRNILSDSTLTASSASAHLNGTVIVSAAVRNGASQTIVTGMRAEIMVRGVRIAEHTHEGGLAPGGSWDIAANWTPQSTGAYNVRLRLFHDLGSYETNITVTVSKEVPRAGLSILRGWLSNDKPSLGEWLTISVTVENLGAGTAKSAPVVFYVNEVKEEEQTIMRLVPGTTQDIVFQYLLDSDGPVNLSVRLPGAVDAGQNDTEGQWVSRVYPTRSGGGIDTLFLFFILIALVGGGLYYLRTRETAPPGLDGEQLLEEERRREEVLRRRREADRKEKDGEEPEQEPGFGPRPPYELMFKDALSPREMAKKTKEYGRHQRWAGHGRARRKGWQKAMTCPSCGGQLYSWKDHECGNEEDIQGRLEKAGEKFSDLDAKADEAAELRRGSFDPRAEAEQRRSDVWGELDSPGEEERERVAEVLESLDGERSAEREARYMALEEAKKEKRDAWDSLTRCQVCGETVYPGEEHECGG
jgi:hypothetical protein